MKAKVDNRVVLVQIVNENYNEHAVEAVIQEGSHKGIYTIIEKHDLLDEKQPKKLKYKMLDVEYHKGQKMFMGEYSVIWAATIGRIELTAGCKTKAEARREASEEIKRLNRKI